MQKRAQGPKKVKLIKLQKLFVSDKVEIKPSG
jgi:hypothetical protein